MPLKMHKVIYEQMPWRKDHVEEIYPNLKSKLVNDESWHDFPLLTKGVGKYRIFQNDYFQAIFARANNRMFDEMQGIPPVDSEADAEWTIWKQVDGYAITSVFTLTPGPFSNTKDVAEWLNRHALGFEEDKDGLRGVAYFADMERGCLSDAMERLAWFEGVILSLNRKFEELTASYWAEIKVYSDEIYNQIKSSAVPDEIIPVPEALRPRGWKHREPIREDDRTHLRL